MRGHVRGLTDGRPLLLCSQVQRYLWADDCCKQRAPCAPAIHYKCNNCCRGVDMPNIKVPRAVLARNDVKRPVRRVHLTLHRLLL